MLFLRMIAVKKGVAIGARKGGKIKTVFYIATGFVCLIFESAVRLGINVENTDSVEKICITIMSLLCILASYISFVDYLVSFKKIFFSKN